MAWPTMRHNNELRLGAFRGAEPFLYETRPRLEDIFTGFFTPMFS